MIRPGAPRTSALAAAAGGSAAGGIYVASGATLAKNATDSFSGNTATGGSGASGRGGSGSNGGAGGASGQPGSKGSGTYGAGGGAPGQPGYHGLQGQERQLRLVAAVVAAAMPSPTSVASARSTNDAVNPVCFASGTLIRTARGEIAVEALAVGDLVVVASGAHRVIRWLGHREIDCCRYHDAAAVLPIRIAAHAFGTGLPTRDLYLSPGHPVLVGADEDGEGGYLVPIMCLINGTTIERAEVDKVTYWHVELDEHDILLAEGLPAESYIDLGSRPWFAGADGALYDPDMAFPGMPGRCRPVAIEGPVVETGAPSAGRRVRDEARGGLRMAERGGEQSCVVAPAGRPEPFLSSGCITALFPRCRGSCGDRRYNVTTRRTWQTS